MVSRNRSWSDLRLSVSDLAANTAQSFDMLINAPTADTLTVVRVIGDFWMLYSPNVTVADKLSIADVGIGVSSVEAFTAAGVSLPVPQDPTQFPPRGWLYVNSQPVTQSSQTEGVLERMAHFKVDLRAMRKVDKGRLFLTLSNTTILTGASMRVIGRTRVLCLT